MKALLIALLLALPLTAQAAKPGTEVNPLDNICVQSYTSWWEDAQSAVTNRILVLCPVIEEIRFQASGTPATKTKFSARLYDNQTLGQYLDLTTLLISNGQQTVQTITYPEPLRVADQYLEPIISIATPVLLGQLPVEYPVMFQVLIRGRYE